MNVLWFYTVFVFENNNNGVINWGYQLDIEKCIIFVSDFMKNNPVGVKYFKLLKNDLKSLSDIQNFLTKFEVEEINKLLRNNCRYIRKIKN